MVKRRKTRPVKLGKVKIGRNSPISIQSMTKTNTADWEGTVRQIHRLEEAGCEIIRVAVPDWQSAKSLSRIKKGINIPLVADIHFLPELALEAISQGIDGLRINPGTISNRAALVKIFKAAQSKKIPVRIGINAGSLPGRRSKSLRKDMAEAALKAMRLCQDLKFYDLIFSLKAFDIEETVGAYQLLAKKCNYPFHLGITEAGPVSAGSIRSAIGIGCLLRQGIGDTIRVSLTADPVEEVKVAREILSALNLRRFGPTIVSCPTCGRCQVDLIKIVSRLEESLKGIYPPNRMKPAIKVAVMGCMVNGPEEARQADIGLAAGRKEGWFFKKGKKIKKIPEKKWVEVLIEEIKKFK
ncbi:MAG: flavodoxin-dependent (E)-4-hydroxy-3-methylbut-2-enyl-diphosphate synthase [Candidatus Ratteibacteria bacterium]|nr:flavodoxin-dependent (E)-4-hydroxy-3-methylbut-2-enyl-diphosphate synthase [Candidatus Ratteibacteria bacterium]